MGDETQIAVVYSGFSDSFVHKKLWPCSYMGFLHTFQGSYRAVIHSLLLVYQASQSTWKQYKYKLLKKFAIFLHFTQVFFFSADWK